MTLIISAITENIAVIGADGFGFGGANGQEQVTQNRRKIFPILNRNVVVAVHGQDKLTVEADSEKPIGDILNTLAQQYCKLNVKDITNKVFDLLSPHVTYTFQQLKRKYKYETVLGLIVIGFDKDGGKPQGFEVFWPKLTADENPNVKSMFETANVSYSGSGTKYAPGSYNPEKLTAASKKSDVQEFVRSLYEQASAEQSRQSHNIFGGEYHEVTITPDQMSWKYQL